MGPHRVSDSTSSDEESMIKSLNVKKSKITSCKTWRRFLIIGSTDEGALRKLSPFAIDKGLQGLAGGLKSVKKLRNWTLLVECATDSHSRNLLKSRRLCNVPIKVTPHSSLNSCNGLIRSGDLEGVAEEEICNNLTSQGVVGVKRINIRRNNELIPMNTLILTFNSPTLPNSVKAGYLNIPAIHTQSLEMFQMSNVWPWAKHVP